MSTGKKTPLLIECPLMKTDHQKRVETLRKNRFDDLYVVASERDDEDPWKSRGAIVHEAYLGHADLIKAVERAESCTARRYGRTQIFKLVPVDIEEAKEAIRG